PSRQNPYRSSLSRAAIRFHFHRGIRHRRDAEGRAADAGARSCGRSRAQRKSAALKNLRDVERRDLAAKIISVAKKAATIYACIECGNQASKWLGRCPECNAWNSYAAEDTAPARTSGTASSPICINDIDADTSPRLSTNIPALDRVLGGGLVFGAVTLVGG